MHGLTKNPHNASVTAGGSSTGTSVGIAAGYATMGLGSDTEGSMRGPAAINGVVGVSEKKRVKFEVEKLG